MMMLLLLPSLLMLMPPPMLLVLLVVMMLRPRWMLDLLPIVMGRGRPLLCSTFVSPFGWLAHLHCSVHCDHFVWARLCV